MKTTKLLLPLAAVFLFSNCTNAQIKSLKTAYKGDFYIGTALDENQIEEKDSKVTKLIATEFNAITAENIMKSMFVHPEKDKFNFETTDKYVAFGKNTICLFMDILWFGIVNYRNGFLK